MSILEGLRIFFGSVFILFLPGFAWSYVFFAKKNIDWIERVALSFGLSIALVPLSVFWLNFLFQMKVTLINTFLVVCGLLPVPMLYVIIKRSSFGKNITETLKSTFKHSKGNWSR